MTATIDSNILIYASNESDPLHERAADLVHHLARGPEIMYLFWPTIMGYLRIVTHPAVLPHPASPTAAAQNIADILSLPHVRTGVEEDGFWDAFQDTAGRQARGNDVPDAHIATLMRQHGVRTIYTRDRGFKRFPGIDAQDPFV